MVSNIKLPLVAILRGITPDEIIEHSQALVEAGFQMIEVPTNSPNWLESIKLLRQKYNDDVIVGAGTVITMEYLEDLIAAQGQIMVTPNTNPELIRKAKGHNLLTCIGALTPTEIFSALQAGADIVKIFPATALDLDYIKAVRPVVGKEVSLYAVGGVTTENLADYIRVGYNGVGLGSDLYKAGQSVARTKEMALKYVQAWEAIQNENH